jgi:phosphatidate cytidylyltransferase
LSWVLLLIIKTENSKRVITAVFLAGVTVVGVLMLESFLFSIAVGLIAVVAALEWCHLGRKTVAPGWNIAFIILVGAGIPTLSIFPSALPWVLGLALVWWIIIGVAILFHGRRSQALKWQAKKWHALLVIVPAAVGVTGLHEIGSEGRWYVLACLLIVWTTDTCAYMVGRVCGKTLLAPGISPTKTVEGVAGGLVGAFIVALILYETLPTEIVFSRLGWVVLVIVTAGFSVIGDLTESAYKRGAGVKDSGWILPGHGGILDRIDSTFASSPVFVVGILLVARWNYGT